MPARKVLDWALLVACYFGIIGFAFGFGKWFDQWVYLPTFPNKLDSGVLILSASYLTLRIILREYGLTLRAVIETEKSWIKKLRKR